MRRTKNKRTGKESFRQLVSNIKSLFESESDSTGVILATVEYFHTDQKLKIELNCIFENREIEDSAKELVIEKLTKSLQRTTVH